LKYAKVESNYVVFDQTKDAYIEMKKVNSPVTGEVTITIVYSNGSGKSLPMEIKVNSTTIESNKEFPSTGAWNIWSTLSVKANMNSGSDNVIRIKTRSNDGGPRIDKVIVSAGGACNHTNANSANINICNPCGRRHYSFTQWFNDASASH